MPTYDIGIDLGTTFIKIYIANHGIVLNEPAVIAYNHTKQSVVAVGQKAYDMLGKAPPHITVQYPLEMGVISDYKLNGLMINELLKKVSHSMLIKPRVCVCIHSIITEVERRAVIDAALAAGARKVFLVEETIAAALGAGIDISKPNGVLIVNIGGGTTDAAVISMNGIVLSQSIRVGGQIIDQTITKYILNTYKLLIGEQTAEQVKKQIATAIAPKQSITMKVKGRNVINGLPEYREISQLEIHQTIQDCIKQIRQIIHDVLEQTPPELIGDISNSGILLTGSGSLLQGIPDCIEQETGIHARLSDEPALDTAVGTGFVFQQLNNFFGGVVDAPIYGR